MNSKSKHINCFVPYCDNSNFKTPNKVFITTPANLTRRKQWFAVVCKAYNKPLRISTCLHCCEDHFDPTNDFENWLEFKTVGKKLKLKPNVVPHIFEKNLVSKTNKAKPLLNLIPGSVLNTDDVVQVEYNASSSSSTTAVFNKSEDKSLLKYSTTVKNPFYTSLGISKNQYFLIKSLKDEINCSNINIFITLKKIRRNDSFDCLRKEFSPWHTSIREIFISTVPKLATLLKRFIIWPCRLKTLLNLPAPLQYKYINVESVIDFFEIVLEGPDSSCDNPLWYENMPTIKYLISVNPEGLINFVSSGYSKCTSEIDIFKNCGYLDVLPKNTTILGDQNLSPLTELIFSKNCKLITSADGFKEESKMFEHYNKQIIVLRKQTKNTVFKLREFKILKTHSYIERDFINIIDDIVTISCALTNLQQSTE